MTHILLVLGFKKEKGKKAHCWTLVAPFVSHEGLRMLRAHTGSDVGPDRALPTFPAKLLISCLHAAGFERAPITRLSSAISPNASTAETRRQH